MSDEWEDVEVWRKVKGASQVRRVVIGGEEWIDVKVDGDVIRIRTSDMGSQYPSWPGDQAENPVHFGGMNFDSEFEEPEVKVKMPNGQTSPWMSAQGMTVQNVVETRIKKVGTQEYVTGIGPSNTAALYPGQYVNMAFVESGGILRNSLQEGGPVYP